jgi:hypothetical protein
MLFMEDTFAGFEVLTAETMKSSLFCDVTPCSPVKVNQHFRGTYHFKIHGRTASQARNQHEAGDKQSARFLRCCLLALLSEGYVLPKLR